MVILAISQLLREGSQPLWTALPAEAAYYTVGALILKDDLKSINEKFLTSQPAETFDVNISRSFLE